MTKLTVVRQSLRVQCGNRVLKTRGLGVTVNGWGRERNSQSDWTWLFKLYCIRFSLITGTGGSVCKREKDHKG